MKLQDKLNDLIAHGFITPASPNTIPHNPSNLSYIPTKTIYSIDLRVSKEDKIKNAKLEQPT